MRFGLLIVALLSAIPPRGASAQALERAEVEAEAEPEVEPEVDAEPEAEPQPADPTPAERPPLPRAVFYGGVVFTVLAAAAGGYFGVTALILHDQEARRDPRLPPDTAGITEAAAIADVFFVTAAALAIATFVVAFFTDWEDPPEPDPEADEDEVRVAPLVGPGMVGLGGTF